MRYIMHLIRMSVSREDREEVRERNYFSRSEDTTEYHVQRYAETLRSVYATYVGIYDQYCAYPLNF